MRYEIKRFEEEGMQYMCNEDLVRLIVDKPAKEIMEASNYSLKNLNKMSVEELTEVSGVGKIKAAQILAALELGRRCYKEKTMESQDLGSSIAIYNYMKPNLENIDHEEFWIIVMNQSFRLLKSKRIGFGGITDVAADVRIIMKEVCLCNGTILAVVHNHPSGSPFPSKNDDLVTMQIAKACEIMRIFFMDHVIVSDGAFYSYNDKGKL